MISWSGYVWRTKILFLVFCCLVHSHDLLDTSQIVQLIPLEDITIDGGNLRVEDQSTRLLNGSLLIQRVVQLTDISLHPVAIMPLEVPPENRNATKLDTLLLPLNHVEVVGSYVQGMIASSFASGILQLEQQDEKKMQNILSIGLGAGILNSYFHDMFNSINITVAEIEPKMYEISKKYFGLTEDNRQRVVIADGLQYLQKLGNESKFDVIFIDACYNKEENGVLCPVETFARKQNLRFVKQALTKNGVVVSQLLTFVNDKNDQIQGAYKDEFRSCLMIDDFLNYANKLLVCGEDLIDKAAFTGKFREIYKKFGFDGEPDVK